MEEKEAAREADEVLAEKRRRVLAPYPGKETYGYWPNPDSIREYCAKSKAVREHLEVLKQDGHVSEQWASIFEGMANTLGVMEDVLWEDERHNPLHQLMAQITTQEVSACQALGGVELKPVEGSEVSGRDLADALEAIDTEENEGELRPGNP